MTDIPRQPSEAPTCGPQPAGLNLGLCAAVLADLGVEAAAFAADGTRLAATNDFEGIIGAPAADLDAVMGALAQRPMDVENLRRSSVDAWSGKRTNPFEAHVPLASGGERVVVVTMAQRCLNDRPCLVLTLEDARSGPKLRQEIDSLARLAAIGQVTATVAHEINNIVTSMLGWTDIARRSANAPTVVLPALEILEANSKRAKTLVSRLLFKTRSEPPKLVPVRLEIVLADALRLLSWELSESSIRIVRRIQPVPPVIGDEDQLHQVILNLVRNAKDAMPQGGVLSVCLDVEQESVVLTIEDSGAGIPNDVLPRIFEPFFSTKKHRDPALPGGTGLGLAICRDIIEAAGGRIEVTSVVGQGTRFNAALPCAQRPPQPEATPSESQDVAFTGVRVLVVDDEHDVGDMIAMALSIKGAEVETAARGDEALAMSRRHSFDVAFVDFTMPGLSGQDLILALRDTRPHMRIVVMSGRDVDMEGMPEVVDFLKKPFELRDIELKLESLLAPAPSGD